MEKLWHATQGRGFKFDKQDTTESKEIQNSKKFCAYSHINIHSLAAMAQYEINVNVNVT